MQNPIAKIQQAKSFYRIAKESGYSRQYIGLLASYSPEKMANIPIKTILKIQEATGIDLIGYIKN